jgi:hypothetical protein
MSDAEKEIRDIISSLGLSIRAERRAPTKREAQETANQLMHRFTVALIDREGHEILRTNYSCGSAYPERWFWEELSDYQRAELCRATGDGAAPPHRRGFMSSRGQTVFEKALSDIIGARFKPSIVDVVGALATDSAHVEPYLPDLFEAWADDIGDDSDSISAREAFFSMVRSREALRRAMDASTFARLCKAGAEL